MKSQRHYYEESHRKISEVNELFMDFVKDGLTKRELRRNIERRPELWGRFANWLEGDKLPD